MNLDMLKTQIRLGNYRLTVHCFERCVERNISPDEVQEAVLSGEIIEEYPEDKYGPSCLIYGKTNAQRILHVQASLDPVWIVTAYDPTRTPEKWEASFKRRKKR